MQSRNQNKNQHIQSQNISQQSGFFNQTNHSQGVSPTSSSTAIVTAGFGNTLGNAGDYKSKNIKKFVQQSNNYWHAERKFFSTGKTKNNNDELYKILNSFECLPNSKKANTQSDKKESSYNSNNQFLNLSNNQQLYDESHQNKQQSSVNRKLNFDIIQQSRNENHSQLFESLIHLEEDQKQKSKIHLDQNSNNCINKIPQQDYQKENELQQYFKTSQSIKSNQIQTNPMKNRNSIILQQQHYNQGGRLTQNINNDDITTNISLVKNSMIINNNVSKNNEQVNNMNQSINIVNKSQNTSSFHSTFIQTNSFSQNKLQDATFSFSYVRKGICTIPKNMIQFNYITLQIIDFSFNKFFQIPPEILEFPNLKVLKLDNNNINAINDELFVKINLEYFSISNNLLQEIPMNITEWSNCLKYLNISFNRIKNIQFLSSLKKLQSLHIHNNDFQNIPSDLSNIENSLLELSLDWFQYTNPALSLRQSGLQGSQIIQKFMNFLKRYIQKDKSISHIVDKCKYFVQKQSENEVNFIEVVEFLSNLNTPFDINMKDFNDSNKQFSHKAAEREEIGCLTSLIIFQKSLINSIDSQGHTPLSISILNEKFQSAKALIQNGANVNLGGSGYGTCLNLATIKYQYYLVLDLLKNGANPNQGDCEGNTPLHYIMTIFHKNPIYSAKICDALLQFQADPNIKNHDGWSPIHLISRRGQIEAFNYMQQYNKYLLENNNINNLLPELNNIPIMKELQSSINEFKQFSSFNFNLKGGKEKQSPLHIACMHCCYDLVTLLLKSDTNVYARNASNKIPLQLCMRDSFLYKILKQKESELFQKFSTVQRQIEAASKIHDKKEVKYYKSSLSRTQSPLLKNQQQNSQQINQKYKYGQQLERDCYDFKNNHENSKDNENKSMSSLQIGQSQNKLSNNQYQVMSSKQNATHDYIGQNKQAKYNTSQKNLSPQTKQLQNISLSSQSFYQNETNRLESTNQSNLSTKSKHIYSQLLQISSQYTQKSQIFQNQQNPNQIPSSQIFLQKSNDHSSERKQQSIRGDQIRDSFFLNYNSRNKISQDHNESIKEDFQLNDVDDAYKESDQDLANNKIMHKLSHNTNDVFNNYQQFQKSIQSSGHKNVSHQQIQSSYYAVKSFEPNSQNRSNLNNTGIQFHDDNDEDFTKEEEFFNGDIDESKSMLELISTKKKLMNQSLPYAPNNIQQLNYIQTVNKTNLQRIQGQNAANNDKSKNIIHGVFQQKKIKEFSLTTNKGNKSNILDLSKTNIQHVKNDYELQRKEDNKIQCSYDDIETHLQIIKPQHISFFNYLLEKAKNMHEYESISLQNYKKGILSEFNTIHEKLRYFVLMMKLQIEYQNMILHLINEKETLQSLLGETSLFNIGVIDQGTTNLMIMKILLEILKDLKCERHSLLHIQINYPSPTQFHIFGPPESTSINYYMEQKEDSVHNTTLTNSYDKIEFIELVSSKQNEEDSLIKNNAKYSFDLQQEIKICERENNILKENIIYQFGHFNFNESIDYLEKEIKSPETSIINAFESCQSFFKIRESLYQKQQNINNNKQRKNKIGMDQKLLQKQYKVDSKSNSYFLSNNLSSNQSSISQNKAKSSLSNTISNAFADDIPQTLNLDRKVQIENTSKHQTQSFYPSKNISNQSSFLYTDSESQNTFRQNQLYKINNQQQVSKISSSFQQQITNQLSQNFKFNSKEQPSHQKYLESSILGINNQIQHNFPYSSDQKVSNSSNGVSQPISDIKLTSTINSQQNSNQHITQLPQNQKSIEDRKQTKQKPKPPSLDSRQVVLNEKDVHQQISLTQANTPLAGSSSKKDYQSFILDQFYRKKSNNSIDTKNQSKYNASQGNYSSYNGLSYTTNQNSPFGKQSESESIYNQQANQIQKKDQIIQNKSPIKNLNQQQQQQQLKQQPQQYSSTLYLKKIQSRNNNFMKNQ